MIHLPDSIKTSLQWDRIKTHVMTRPCIYLCFTAFLNLCVIFFFLPKKKKMVPVYYFIYFRWNDPETGMCFLYLWKACICYWCACVRHMVAEWLQGSSSSLMVPHNPIFRLLYVRPSSWLYCRIFMPFRSPVVFCFLFICLHLDR